MAYPSLEFFLVIAKYKSLTKASQELFVTQQNLSSYLKRLESYYGLELFTRHPKFELTEFGKILYQEALEIQNIYHCQIQGKARFYRKTLPHFSLFFRRNISRFSPFFGTLRNKKILPRRQDGIDVFTVGRNIPEPIIQQSYRHLVPP